MKQIIIHIGEGVLAAIVFAGMLFILNMNFTSADGTVTAGFKNTVGSKISQEDSDYDSYTDISSVQSVVSKNLPEISYNENAAVIKANTEVSLPQYFTVKMNEREYTADEIGGFKIVSVKDASGGDISFSDNGLAVFPEAGEYTAMLYVFDDEQRETSVQIIIPVEEAEGSV